MKEARYEKVVEWEEEPDNLAIFLSTGGFILFFYGLIVNFRQAYLGLLIGLFIYIFIWTLYKSLGKGRKTYFRRIRK